MSSAADDAFDPLEPLPPLDDSERAEVAADLDDLDVFQRHLEPRDVRGLVVDCADCEEPHYFGWDLLRGNLRSLLHDGESGVHEPAYDPDPDHYVTWDYARGFVDARES